MKTGSIICLVIFVAGSLLSLAQLWFTPFSSAIFIKIIITLAVIFVIVLGVTLVRKEYIEDKKMKDDDYID